MQGNCQVRWTGWAALFFPQDNRRTELESFTTLLHHGRLLTSAECAGTPSPRVRPLRRNHATPRADHPSAMPCQILCAGEPEVYLGQIGSNQRRLVTEQVSRIRTTLLLPNRLHPRFPGHHARSQPSLSGSKPDHCLANNKEIHDLRTILIHESLLLDINPKQTQDFFIVRIKGASDCKSPIGK